MTPGSAHAMVFGTELERQRRIATESLRGVDRWKRAAARAHATADMAERGKEEAETRVCELEASLAVAENAGRELEARLAAAEKTISDLQRVSEPRETPAPREQARGLGAPAPASTQRHSSIGDGWTLDGFLASLPAVNASLAAAVRKAPGATGKTELEFIRVLGNEANGHAMLLALLQNGGALEAVTDAAWTGIEKLVEAKAATGLELQGKFLADGAGTLSYSGLSTFYGGLEAKIGAPDPLVREAMDREHTAEGGDRHDEFCSGNYEVTTTSAIEWAFVATPAKPPTTTA